MTIAWLNFGLLLASSVLFTVLYVKSVGPAALAQQIGASAYAKCTRWRVASGAFMCVATGCYVLYHWFPLPVPLPPTFPWPWSVSAVAAVAIAVPSLYLMLRGMKDAGEETMAPKPEHSMYGGIYARIRHPQAAGELPLWWAVAFAMHSPFLVLFSLLYVPVWYAFCVFEERDLLLRYGAEYEEYRQRTGFWLPRAGGARESS